MSGWLIDNMSRTYDICLFARNVGPIECKTDELSHKVCSTQRNRIITELFVVLSWTGPQWLCSTEERMSYRLGTTQGWVNGDWTFKTIIFKFFIDFLNGTTITDSQIFLKVKCFSMSFRASISSIKPKIALAYTLLLRIQLEERGQEWLKEQLNHFTSTDMKNIIVVFLNHCQGVEESNVQWSKVLNA